MRKRAVRITKLVTLCCLALMWTHSSQADTSPFESVESNGVRRFYKVHLPSRAASDKLPAIIVLHGGGGNVEQIESSIHLDELGDREGFVTIYPEGTGFFAHRLLTWNAGACCGAAAEKNIDDVSFISKMIDEVVKNHPIDRTRIYATGFSNGSQMSYRLACELSEKIAAIAPVSGQIVFPSCRPARAVPLLHIHGRLDRCAPYDGGPACGGCFAKVFGIGSSKGNFPCPGVEPSVKSWARMNGCNMNSSTIISPQGAVCSKFTGCTDGASVRLCTVELNGHIWPGGENGAVCADTDSRMCRRFQNVLGPANHRFDTNQEIWNFLKRFSLSENPGR